MSQAALEAYQRSAGQAHDLDWLGLDLTGGTNYGTAARPLRFQARPEGASLGSAEPVTEVIASALLDGSLVIHERDENRQPTFQIRVLAKDSGRLSEGDAMLAARRARPGILGFLPPDRMGERTEYRVLTSDVRHDWDDVLELNLVRAYTLSLTCAPFGYSATEVSQLASTPPPASPQTVVISDGTSAAGWTSTRGTVRASGGFLRTPAGRRSGSNTRYLANATLTFGSPVSFAATPFVTVDVVLASSRQVMGPGGPTSAVQLLVNGVRVSAVSYVSVSSSQGTRPADRITFRLPESAGPVSTLRLNVEFYDDPAGLTSPDVLLDNVQRSNVSPAGSGKQTLQLVSVGGSARTAGSLSVSHASKGLGDVLAYTSPALERGYTPDLRRYRNSASVTTTNDSDAVNGSRLKDVIVMDVPASTLPEGSYVLMARANNSATRLAATLTIETVVNGVVFGPVRSFNYSGTFLASGFAIINFGVANLPAVRIPAESSAVVRFTVQFTDGNSTVRGLDELWAYWLGGGSALTQVACGTGTPAAGTVHSRLWLDNATLGDTRPNVRVGVLADQSDSFTPALKSAVDLSSTVGVVSRMVNSLRPPLVKLHLVTTGADNPEVWLRHTPAWLNYAGDPFAPGEVLEVA